MDIKQLREQTGLSQTKFADKYHINIWTLRNWEQGRDKPSECIMYLLSRVIADDMSDKGDK